MNNSEGYAGKILTIDLSTGEVGNRSTFDYVSQFLGGRGLASKIYWDEVPPEVGAFDAENRLIFATGPMTGVPRIGGSRWVVSAKTPKTIPDHYNYSNLGGQWGAELKFAGHDALVVGGKAARPAYILIEDNMVQIRDAAALWGRGAVETRIMLKGELGDSYRVVAIGPAGENRVTIATINADNDASGSAGMGAVMGAKNIKAIVVKSSRRVTRVAQPEKLRELGKYLHGLWHFPSSATVPHLLPMDPVPDIFPKLKKSPCYGCPGCVRKDYQADDGSKGKFFCHSACFYQLRALKYYGAWNDAGFHASKLLNEFGVSSHEIDYILNWLERCTEAGILNDGNTGLKLSEMGSLEFLTDLLQKMSQADGFGGLLAQGLEKAARQFGPEAIEKYEECTLYGTKCKTFYDPRLYLTGAFFYAMEPRDPIQHLHEISIRISQWLAWEAGIKGAYLSSQVLREIAKRFWGSELAADFSTYAGKALAAKMIQDREYAKESLVLCDLLYPLMNIAATEDHVGDPALESKLLSIVTGNSYDEQDLSRIGARLFNLQRAILVREGWRGRTDDTLEDLYFTRPLEFDYLNPGCMVPGEAGRAISRKGEMVDREKFEAMKDEYYGYRNWDTATGLPTKEALETLELNDVAADLGKRGLLKS